jgi:hypothetical protein
MTKVKMILLSIISIKAKKTGAMVIQLLSTFWKQIDCGQVFEAKYNPKYE